ncbi:5-methyltetrahydropteroyltriglutamate--homocysteine S-methyltransferase [Roseicella frigidaeris]|uniref:5-methyltetrahydropteroyltriglutamate--homocysteine methyltransferase n=1 Tax=Roseicella frigidaeris TaxID=2230885 RepID=A0A327M3H0_9PROT|nr:5-methyltetrahydropteroyltriglutamate--homocysteine S-methyltransferase [Roseicella frigidaeris]RAI57811.1 5-methyltetrahydropteroyltriglutamate--homocysteine S-methyltransferase [Roseicella frigidaeris]
MAVSVATLGFPRIGPRRELKAALERYWAGTSSRAELLAAAAELRAKAWARQKALGADIIPSNDFSLYDQVLDTSAMVGAIPSLYGWIGGPVDLDTYFAMARGAQGEAHAACGAGCMHKATNVPAAEMTKWFDTNYHYLVPEFAPGQAFALSSTKAIDEYLEAKAQGIETRPVLIGPVTYLKLGKSHAEDLHRQALLRALLPVYAEVLGKLAAAGAAWVQIDEPCLVLDLTAEEHRLLAEAYAYFARAVPGLKLMLTTYFGGLGDNLDAALALPVAGLHIDLVRAPEQLEPVLAKAPRDRVLSLGVIDGRNVWRADLDAILDRLEPVARAGRSIVLAPSCSLLHSPIDLAQETALDAEVRSWLAFAVQKIEELAILARALNEGRGAVAEALAAAAAAARSRRTSPRIHDPAVGARLAQVTEAMARRNAGFAERRRLQAEALRLPAFPTTTIGSFPQTEAVRKARAAHGKGALTDAQYEEFLREETARTVRWQERIGLDVLVHGEFERNDMVQYFGEQLAGFVFTKHGWVQSYGSRCVRPPILFGDVSRPQPMTVAWWRYAQSLTDRPMKGMLTGPVTILNWSFVRDDIPRALACRQLALAIRDEVVDLEQAGARIVQIDEAALREGLPLRRGEWEAYLRWAVECFRLAASGVADRTQIHTHMCYSEFNDIIQAIGAMDADVISIETARSKMELLGAFAEYRYPAEIGPGVYDIHSPRVPAVEEMVELLRAARRRLAPEQLWVNPDCGLKTRKWPETEAALVNMVAAAQAARAEA